MPTLFVTSLEFQLMLKMEDVQNTNSPCIDRNLVRLNCEN